MKFIKTLLAAVCALSVTGCASIVGDTDQNITINSSPDDAEVIITDETSQEVFSGETPATVQLRKSDGSYFGGKTYHVTVSKEGYSDRTVTIDSNPSGWYIAGNLGFGGLIGWLVVDPLTGAMYNLNPDDIDADLGEEVASTDEGSSMTLVLLEDVPESERNNLEKIGTI
ncbi:peptidase associated/transthyretin-like domain-containing protein [Aidingimonas lacisalsi]|uniref:PEGA domain-containing protein n=1 Tax=Aidingimonas lacisalsi TaxID=2604086 RepID=UPI0011D1F158|nr:PEGA domain-containing protein [Aidingimonas lacisalsi]